MSAGTTQLNMRIYYLIVYGRSLVRTSLRLLTFEDGIVELLYFISCVLITHSSGSSFGWEDFLHTNLFGTFVNCKNKFHVSYHVVDTEFGTFIQWGRLGLVVQIRRILLRLPSCIFSHLCVSSITFCIHQFSSWLVVLQTLNMCLPLLYYSHHPVTVLICAFSMSVFTLFISQSLSSYKFIKLLSHQQASFLSLSCCSPVLTLFATCVLMWQTQTCILIGPFLLLLYWNLGAQPRS